jgi:hypothetical protein
MRFTRSPSLSNEHDEIDVGPHDLDERRDSFDERIKMEPEESTYDPRLRWPQSGVSHRSAVAGKNRSKRPSVVRRMSRAAGRFLFAVMIGVGATLSWQSYGDDAREAVRETVATWAPSLAWLMPVSTTQSPTPIASSPDLAQQLQPIALDIAVVRRQVEQLAVDQQQLGANQVSLAQSVATLQSVEQGISEKVSSLPQLRAVHLQPRKPAQRPAESSHVQ